MRCADSTLFKAEGKGVLNATKLRTGIFLAPSLQPSSARAIAILFKLLVRDDGGRGRGLLGVTFAVNAGMTGEGLSAISDRTAAG